MVLRLKAWESRSLPGLHDRSNILHKYQNNQTVAHAAVFLCPNPSLKLSPAHAGKVSDRLDLSPTGKHNGASGRRIEMGLPVRALSGSMLIAEMDKAGRAFHRSVFHRCESAAG